MTADVEKTGTEIMTADAENAANPERIPDPLFLSRDREHADAKDHRTVTEKV